MATDPAPPGRRGLRIREYDRGLGDHVPEPASFPEVVVYGFLADLMVVIHVGYVAYVVVGQLLIWVGWALGWKWVRNFWFRATHLLAIAVVAFEQVMEIRCPLTVWEEHFRTLAGQPVTGETFLGRLMHSILFHDFEPWVFGAIYFTTLAVVALTALLCPPRRPFRKVAAGGTGRIRRPNRPLPSDTHGQDPCDG